MLKIGDFSRLSRISIRMLRYYDKIGLLKPVSIDRFTDYRYYSEEQLNIAGKIVTLRSMDFSLNQIHEILAAKDDSEAVESHYLQQKANLLLRQKKTAQMLNALDTALKNLRKETTMEYHVTVKTIPARYAACVRMILSNYEAEGVLWSTLISETTNLKLKEADPCLCAVTFYDGDYREKDVDCEASKAVTGSYPDTEHVSFRTLPAVTVASVTHRGSYSTLNEAYAALGVWMENSDYEYAGAFFNIYHISPHETQNPDEFVTEVCYPIAKKTK